MIGSTRYRLQAEINRQSQLSDRIARGQSDISSGVRIQRASDDPVATLRVGQIRRTQANQETWQANLTTAKAVADQVDTVLSGVAQSVERASELMLAARNSTLSDSDRAAIASELRGIAEDIDSATTTVDSRGLPIFPTTDALPIPISANVRVEATLSKREAFDEVTTAAGPVALSQIMRDAATAITLTDPTLRETDGITSVNAINAALDHMSAIRGEQGVRAARIESVNDQIEENKLQIEEERAQLEGTDVADTVAKLQANLLSLQAAQAAFAKINSRSLFDLI
jgi:flagellar hook-associated protein 3 FlgL